MRKPALEAMDFDELWRLHQELTKVLAEKISAEKRKLEERLSQLGHAEQAAPRRKYPKVLPKYVNSAAPLETWSGRGKQPRWLVAALKSGRKLEEFQIPKPGEASEKKGRRGRRT
jgi:DNA-binding protein H-NS